MSTNTISTPSPKKSTKDLFVIVGWSSPERKDFYFKGDWDGDFIESWETLYPAQLEQSLPNKDVEKFYDTYLKYFWHSEEYINRYVNQNLYLHYFLESKGVRHLFFDAFYHHTPQEHNKPYFGDYYDIKLFKKLEDTNRHLYTDLNKNMKETTKEYFKLRDTNFHNISFKNFK